MNKMIVGICGLLAAMAASAAVETEMSIAYSAPERCKIDALAPLAYCSKDIPPIISICGEEPWEWKCRSEENRLLISSCVALGHDKAWFVSCPFADHGRVFTAGVPYVEMFVQGRLPAILESQVNKSM